MTELDQHLQRINSKLQILLKEYHALKKENRQLRAELDTSGEKLLHQQKNMDQLKQQLSVLQLTAGGPGNPGMNPADKKEFEKKINGYIKEIDRCIALLGE